MGGKTVMDGDGNIDSKSSSQETSLSPQSTLKTSEGRAQHISSGGDEALPQPLVAVAVEWIFPSSSLTPLLGTLCSGGK